MPLKAIKKFWDSLSPKQKTEKRKKIDAQLNAKFETNCNSTATSVQLLEVKDIKVVARGNCTVSFINESTLDSKCDMKPIIKSVTNSLVATDKELAKLMTGEENSISNTISDKDLKLKIKKHLELKCNSHAKATQTLKVTGVNIYCDQDAGSVWKNSTEVRATCLKEMFHDALERQTEFEKEDDKKGDNDDDDDDNNDMMMYMMIGFVVFLFLIAMLKQRQNNHYY